MILYITYYYYYITYYLLYDMIIYSFYFFLSFITVHIIITILLSLLKTKFEWLKLLNEHEKQILIIRKYFYLIFLILRSLIASCN